MRIIFKVIFSLILVQLRVIAGNSFESEQDVKPADEINPPEYGGFTVTQDRNEFLAQKNIGSDDICGQTCTGPLQYPFGLLACLREGFEKDKVMPTVELSDISGEISLPKVVFSPSTSLNDIEFELAEYNKARVGYSTASRLPAAVLFAETTADVIKGVNCARVNGYTVAARGRGHDYGQGVSVEGSLVIDMQLNCKFDAFVPDKNAKGVHNDKVGSEYVGKMTVPSGCTNAAFLAAVNRDFKEEGGMNIIGSCPSVGVTGYFLNGGYGDQTPWIGLGSDVVDEIKMVLYDGTHITASENENKEIFWASKGGSGGIGIVTSFLARVIKNPSPAKKYTAIRFFYKPLTYKGTDLDQQVDRLMRFQEFLAENDKGRLFGGQSGYFEGRFFFQGTFLGSIDEMIKVFTDARLLEKDLFEDDKIVNPTFFFPSRVGIYPDNCEGADCQKEKNYGKSFPANGIQAFEFNSQAEVQGASLCSFLNDSPQLRFLSFGYVARRFNICNDLDFDDEDDKKYCEKEEEFPLLPLLPQLRFIKPLECFRPKVIAGFLEAAKKPQSFLNRKGFSDDALFLNELNYPNPRALGNDVVSSASGYGTGGLILPKLEEKTLREILRSTTDRFDTNHLVHGAPLTIEIEDDLYPHRNGFWNTPTSSRTSKFINILLTDIAFGEDPLNLPIYGNYNPSYFMPDYETHVYGGSAEELSRIRTKYDPIGGFDSPRYPQRDRRRARTVRKSNKKDKKKKKTK